ncbi:Crp/Fnr family transcriptional regulator [Hydrogenophaga sp.]|uniref:Crp/Fnr family transcriptional regulator n=1 Tax=Hydrogenophaga sp. TaxID=1904254 RepID=UPI003561ED56
MPSLTQVNSDTHAESLLQRLLEQAAGAPLPDWPLAAQAMRRQAVERGGTVFHHDTTHPYLYAVRQGLVKLCYLNENGDEWIKSFAHEGRFFASVAALTPGGRTSFTAVALEPTQLERLDYRCLADLASRHLAWSRAAHQMTLIFAARKEQRERELLTLGPEARYRAFCAEHPALAQRVAQKDLARHLGLTPVGLNRIAARVRKQAD